MAVIHGLDMIKIMFYIRAQRTSDITLHLTSTRSMLLYFIAAGHHQFAKGARLTLWLYDVWRQQYSDLVKKFFEKGLHTVRYLSRNWSGTWTARSIEHIGMREAKTSGGIVHGTLRNEDSLDIWFHLVEHTSKVSGKIENLIK